jgi:uncharacterized protein
MPGDLCLAAIHVYPIKSAGGFAVESWPVDSFGLQLDRRWMVIDQFGRAVTQREQPRLALVRTEITDGALRVTAPGMPALELALHPSPAVTTSATVWDDTCEARWLGKGPSDWFADLLGIPCSLVFMPETTRRPVDPGYAPAAERVSFADAFPFLLLSQESLAALNERLARPVPMNRFRPNLVVAGGAPHVEDTLRRFRIGDLELEVVKPCDRCVLTTTDQSTAERGPEPLRTLAAYRKVGSKVLFGQNVVHYTTGRLTVGEKVFV